MVAFATEIPQISSPGTCPAKVPPATLLMPATWNSSDTPVIIYIYIYNINFVIYVIVGSN